MTTKHPQEKIIKTFHFNGIEVDVAEWNETKWCGKIGYAPDNMDEPDVEKIMNDFFEVNDSAVAYEREEGWDVCISFNYLSGERPNGVMFGLLVGMENQPDCFDIVRQPPVLYMRI